MPLKIIITGVTGMVGEGVLHECLLSPEIEKILVVTRKSSGTIHPKLSEIILADFFNPSSIINSLSGYDACFFCAGISSVGMKEDKYRHITYDTTLSFARTLLVYNPNMVFTYVSGSHTDSSEKGKLMWARVKGKTENDLMKLPFKKVYAFRPGFMRPTSGLKNTLKGYTFLTWLYPVLRSMFPGFVSTLKEVGDAMINTVNKGYEKSILEVRDIVKLAHA